MSSIKAFECRSWTEVCNRIIGAIVFIDKPTAECLHWIGGLSLLTEGAVAVRSLSPFEYATETQKKGVFITQLTSKSFDTMKEIIKRSCFTQCVVISTTSLEVLYKEMWEENNPVSTENAAIECERLLKENITEWMACEHYVVEINFIPIFTISPTNNIFLMPPHDSLFPLFKDKLIQEPGTNQVNALSSDERTNLIRLTSNLNALLEELQLKEDVYFMGSYSSMIADILGNNPAYVARKKRCMKQASLILIDRTLDLGSVTSHSMETVFDKIMAVLPKLPDHCTDIAVDMSPLCRATNTTPDDDTQLSPGCLQHPNDDFCIEMINQFINEPSKQALLFLYNRLAKIDVGKSPIPQKLVKVTPQSIDKIIAVCKENYDLIEKNSGVLQQSLAIRQLLTSPILSKIELLSNLEKQVLENVATCGNSTSVLLLVCSLIKNRKTKNVDLLSLLTLLIYVYSLSDVKFNPLHETELETLLSVAIFEDLNDLSAILCYRPSCPEDCDNISRSIMMTLRDVGSMRTKLDKYKTVIKTTESGVEYFGLLRQIWADLVNSKNPLPDLNMKTEGLKDLVRSGLTLFGKNRTTKHILDSSTIIIFVVGGINADECRRLRYDIEATGHNHVVIGSTKMAAGDQIGRNVFKKCWNICRK